MPEAAMSEDAFGGRDAGAPPAETLEHSVLTTAAPASQEFNTALVHSVVHAARRSSLRRHAGRVQNGHRLIDVDAEPGHRVGLAILAAEELLRHLPAVTVRCDPPTRADPAVRNEVIGLLTAVAERLDTTSADRTRSPADRLARDGAAGQLRRARAVLP
jgi:hypothetical protein